MSKILPASVTPHPKSRSNLIIACLAAIAVVLASCGGGGKDSPHAPWLALFAGNLGGAGSADGLGAAARFNNPMDVATDYAGNIYVADTNNTIRKITPAGKVSTLAGTAGVRGSADGTGTAASFFQPSAVAIDYAGNIYVADYGNNTIRKITPAGEVSTLAGTAGVNGSTDDSGAAASFNKPQGIATDFAGNIYVADTGNNTIRKISLSGAVTTLVGSAGVKGSADGTGIAARFSNPMGVATDHGGNVYVADTNNNTIRKITPEGKVSTLAGIAGVSGSADGSVSAASFSQPTSIATDNAGDVYVVDSWNYTIREITPAGVVTTLAGTAGVIGSADGIGAAASFCFAQGIATDGSGNIYVADSGNNTIRKIMPPGIVSTLAGMAAVSGHADGSGSSASFFSTAGIATDSAGNVYVADNNNTVRKITPAGVVSTLAGTAGVGGSNDGAGTTAKFYQPTGITTDSAGSIYVADSGNNTIRKITQDGVVSTLAGRAGIRGSADGSGSVASFNYPAGMATDSADNIYVADVSNNTIRKITPAGDVSTLAGTAGKWGYADGIGAAARFNHSNGIAIDRAGNIYVADTLNCTIRKITPAGAVTTLAGRMGVSGSADGSGAAARFFYPAGVATDSAGNVYVADAANSTIRKITPANEVTTVVGRPGQAEFVAGTLTGVLLPPNDVAINGSSLYISEGNGVAVVSNLLNSN